MVSGGCLEGVWKVFGKCLEGVWKVFGWYPEDVRTVSGGSLDGVRKVSGRYLEGVLKVSGLKGLWKVFGTCFERVLNESRRCLMLFGNHLERIWKAFRGSLQKFCMV